MNTLKKLSLALVMALPLAVNAAPRTAAPFTDAEIDQLLAPIALYPDTVLSHVLIAATVPEDVEAAADWTYRHEGLRGQEAVDAVARYDWDPSVKALVAFPEVLERMDEDPDWTEDLGLAFLEQEETVMDRVQYLRDRAYDNGSLDDLEQVRVVREREYIYIEPAVSRVVYVPYYNPLVVYGTWWWASYPPHCWNWWAGYPVAYYGHTPFYWGVSYHLGVNWYASSFNWPYRHVVVTRPHRHYAPTPGYSGRSSMRRDIVHLDSRQARRSTLGQSGHTSTAARRDHTPVRRGHRRHDEGTTHVPQGPRHARRDWTQVQASLAARRDASRDGSRGHRTDASPRGERSSPAERIVRGDSSRGRSEGARLRETPRVRDVERHESRGRSGERRQYGREASGESPRIHREGRPQSPRGHESRPAPRHHEQAASPAPRVESRSAPRVEPRGESGGASRSSVQRHGNGGSSGGSNGGERGGGSRVRAR